MSRKRPGFSPAEHVEIGRLICAAYRALTLAAISVSRAYGKNDPAARSLTRLVSLAGPLTKIKSDLDNHVCSEVSRSRDPRALATRCYYGRGLLEQFPSGDDHDAFRDYQLPSPDLDRIEPEATEAEIEGALAVTPPRQHQPRSRTQPNEDLSRKNLR